jgi:hypothetical protein
MSRNFAPLTLGFLPFLAACEQAHMTVPMNLEATVVAQDGQTFA